MITMSGAMQAWQTVLLAIVQGVTEFLPVSSSGHLVIAQKLLGLNTPPVFLDIILHTGTLLAILFFLRKEILDLIVNWRKNGRFFLYLVLASLPAAVVGFFFNQHLERLFSSSRIVGVSLIVTGLFLLSTRRIRKDTTSSLRFRQVTFIGLSQALSVLPGISRSGATISSGLLFGLSPELSFRFSFYLAIPAIVGATLLRLLSGGNDFSRINRPVILLGFVVSFIVGSLALKLLNRVVRKGKLYYFSFYCFCLGLITLLFLR